MDQCIPTAKQWRCEAMLMEAQRAREKAEENKGWTEVSQTFGDAIANKRTTHPWTKHDQWEQDCHERLCEEFKLDVANRQGCGKRGYSATCKLVNRSRVH